MRAFLTITIIVLGCGKEVQNFRSHGPVTDDSSVDALPDTPSEKAPPLPTKDGVSEPPPDATPVPEEPASEPTASPLALAITYWESFAPLCEGSPSKEDCDDGDATLFNGLLCASGTKLGCDAVAKAQGTSGQWWRSPRRVDGNLGQNKSFSRDMSLGVLLYVAATHDANAAEHWLDWIEDNRPCSVTNPATGGCSVFGLHRFCRDDAGSNSCTITPAIWSLMADVWEFLGLDLHPNMEQFRNSYDEVAPDEAQNTEPGYQLHLKGVQAYLKKIIAKESNGSRSVIATLAARQADNPFFRYLASGYSVALEEFYLGLCPRAEENRTFRKHQWSWERDTASLAHLESMGWDCLFLANLRAD